MIIARHESYHWLAVAHVACFLYDAEFDRRDISFDAAERVLTLPIVQRLYELADNSYKWIWFPVKRARTCRCILTFRSVTKYEISGEVLAPPWRYSIGDLKYSRDSGAFQLLTHEGAVVRIETESPTVSLELTDEGATNEQTGTGPIESSSS